MIDKYKIYKLKLKQEMNKEKPDEAVINYLKQKIINYVDIPESTKTKFSDKLLLKGDLENGK
jgi:hypothetical protein